jgi:CubicO group peptidase (beta-lactamase class C family)
MFTRTILFLLILSQAGLSASIHSKESTIDTSYQTIAEEAEKIAKRYHQLGWFSGSVLVSKGEHTIYSNSFGYSDLKRKIKNTPDTKYNLGSIMKDFTKVLVLQQMQNGNLSLTDKLKDFGLEFSHSDANEITIEQLLNHTSGFKDIFIAQYRENQMYFDTLEKKFALLVKHPLMFKPGTERKYSNYGYVVLGIILEKITGKSFEQLLAANIFNRLEMTNTSFKVNQQEDNQSIRYTYLYTSELQEVGVQEHPGPSGGIESTTGDLKKFYRALFYGDRLLDSQNKIVREIFEMDSAHWDAFGGGLGISAAAEINLSKGLEIIVLANSDKLVAERISGKIAAFIENGQYDEPTEHPINFTYKTYKTDGKDAFNRNFSKTYSQSGYTQFIGRVVNELGMQLLKSGQWNEATDMFNYLILQFPNAPQAYDSLAFAYFKNAQHDKAKEIFQKALSLKPTFNSDYVSSNYQ